MDGSFSLYSPTGWVVLIIWLCMFAFVFGAKNDTFGVHRVLGFLSGIGVFIAVMIYMTGNRMEKNLGSSVVSDVEFAHQVLIASGAAGVSMFVIYMLGVARS